MNVTINSMIPDSTVTGTLQLKSMGCHLSGGVYPEYVSGDVELTKADNVSFTSTYDEVKAAAIAKFKANIDALVTPKVVTAPAE